MRIMKIPDISTLPALGRGKNAQSEDKLYRWLMKAINGVALDPKDEPQWSKFCTFKSLGGVGSDNWPLMAASIWLWSSPLKVIESLSARDFWIRFFRWQLGVFKSDAIGDTRYFGLSELWSNTYDGMNVGSVLSVRLWAVRNQDQELLDLTSRWLGVWYSSLYLSHSVAPSRIISHLPGESVLIKMPNRRPNVPSLLQIGGRSTPLHYLGDPRQVLLGMMIEWNGLFHPWIDDDPWDWWFVQIAQMLDGNFGEIIKGLRSRPDAESYLLENSSVEYKGLYTVSVWKDGTILGLAHKITNGNTGAVIATTLRPDGTVENFYPWKGRNLAKPKDMSGIQIDMFDGYLIVSSSHGECPAVRIPDERPINRYTFSESGFSKGE